MLPGKHYRPEDIVEALRRRRWYVIAPFWAIAIGTAAFTHTLPDRYESQVRLRLVTPPVTDLSGVRSASAATLAERLPGMTSRVLTADRLQRIASQVAASSAGASQPTDAVAATLQRDLRVQVLPPDTVSVTYGASTAQTAFTVTERLGAAFVEENRRQSQAMTTATSDLIDAQLEDARKQLEAHEKRLEAYRMDHAGELPSEMSTNLQLLQGTQTQLQAARESIAHDRDELMSLDRLIGETEDGSLPVVPSAQRKSGGPSQDLQAAIDELHALQLRLKPDHPDIALQKRRIANLEAQAAAARVADSGAAPESSAPPTPETLARKARLTDLRNRRGALDRQVTAKNADVRRLEGMVTSYQNRIEATPRHETELTALMRDYETLKGIYTKVLAKKEDARMSALQHDEIAEQFVIVDPAKLPGRPVSPNRLQFDIVGALAGLLLGVGLAGLIEYRDRSIRTSDDVVASVGLTVLATIPIIVTNSDRRWTWLRPAMFSVTGAAGIAVTFFVLWRVIR